MTELTSSFNRTLVAHVRKIYPDLDADILSSQIVEAFWPEGKARRKRGQHPSNTRWSEKDALLITYGNSLIDGAHKPLDLLYDFLLRYLGKGEPKQRVF